MTTLKFKMESAADTNLNILVKQMGFSSSEASMALKDCNGNIEVAVEKLIAGVYSPPKYSEIDKDAKVNPLGTRPNPPDFNAPTRNLYPNLYPDSNPPPYTKALLETELKGWEDKSAASFFKLDKSFSSMKEIRCSSCCDVIYEGHEKSGVSNKAVKDGPRDYHYDCYMKTRGPRCAHCCFPLSKIDLDRNFTGQFLIYEDRKYHVECYEKYAGPRCSFCFNVIIEVPGGDMSGCWIGQNNKIFHAECFYKKQESEIRSKNA